MKTVSAFVLMLWIASPLAGQDGPDRWSGVADVLLDSGETYHCAMVSESLQPNAWQLTFVTESFPDYQTTGRVVVLSHTGGRILVAVVGWGVMILTPADSAIRNYFAAGAGGVSTKVQRFTMRRTGAGETRILIEQVQ